MSAAIEATAILVTWIAGTILWFYVLQIIATKYGFGYALLSAILPLLAYVWFMIYKRVRP